MGCILKNDSILLYIFYSFILILQTDNLKENFVREASEIKENDENLSFDDSDNDSGMSEDLGKLTRLFSSYTPKLHTFP